MADFELIQANAEKYNGANHYITQNARMLKDRAEMECF